MTSYDPYADVIDDPIRYADCAEWLIAEARHMADGWRNYAVPDQADVDYPFSWEQP